jgi:hypothetical protein
LHAGLSPEFLPVTFPGHQRIDRGSLSELKPTVTCISSVCFQRFCTGAKSKAENNLLRRLQLHGCFNSTNSFSDFDDPTNHKSIMTKRSRHGATSVSASSPPRPGKYQRLSMTADRGATFDNPIVLEDSDHDEPAPNHMADQQFLFGDIVGLDHRDDLSEL